MQRSLFFLHISHANDLRGGAELFVIAKGFFVLLVIPFEQGDAGIELERHVLRQPDFSIHASSFNYQAGAFVDACQKPAERNRIQSFDIQLGKLQILLIDP